MLAAEGLKVYNTLTKKLELFKPLQQGKVNMFVCGPTVYDEPHLGHARSYIVFDVIAKWLAKYFDVYYLQNITDIDDKIIEKANREGVSWKSIAEKFEKAYFEAMNSLGVDSVNQYARATEFVEAIKQQVKILLDKGIAYIIPNDGVYFDISKFPSYGKLSGQSLESLKAGARVAVSSEKRNPQDFALWKFEKPNEPSWPAPFGNGRPGWHIEDTAITMTVFGNHYDLHGGGLDLIFPHHECEIAIAESITGEEPFVNYWLHNGFVNVKGEKMSKSLKNFVTIKELLKTYSKQEIRMFVVSTHYRSPIDFNPEQLKLAQEKVLKIKNFLQALKHCNSSQDLEEINIDNIVEQSLTEFEQAMNNDFDTPKALATVFKLLRTLNPYVTARKLSKQQAGKVLEFFKFVDSVLGIVDFPEQVKIPEQVLKLVQQREQARKQKDFKKADMLRHKIKSLGFYVDDTPQGPVVKKIEQQENKQQ
ncbi:cysteine--tRNA ligase [Candidatus Woesearchaeota archaeon]|nr:cysteine--tRNA ligase [Candidatus Woesearchaeota archaeon]